MLRCLCRTTRWSAAKCSTENIQKIYQSSYILWHVSENTVLSLEPNHICRYEIRPTLATVSHIKPTSKYVTGLIAELVGQPGVRTALVTVRRPAHGTGKLPHGSATPTSGPCRKPVCCHTWQRKARAGQTRDKDVVRRHRSQGDVHEFTQTVSPIPVTGGVVTGFVAVPILDPRARAALGAVRHRPRKVNLGRMENTAMLPEQA